MTQPSSSIADNRLQRLLISGEGLGLTMPPAQNLAEKLGQMIDLSDSISLSESLRGLSRVSHSGEQPLRSAGSVAAFMNAREDMLRFIASSFVSDASSVPFLLPRANADTLNDINAGFQPFQRFYSLHQSEMDQRTAALRRQLRDNVSAVSSTLAKLAALDRMMAETLAENSRRVLAALPRLMARRFREFADEHLQACEGAEYGEPHTWSQPGGWLHRFCQEMQSLLLAELDFRLLPALGLLEALEHKESPIE